MYYEGGIGPGTLETEDNTQIVAIKSTKTYKNGESYCWDIDTHMGFHELLEEEKNAQIVVIKSR